MGPVTCSDADGRATHVAEYAPDVVGHTVLPVSLQGR